MVTVTDRAAGEIKKILREKDKKDHALKVYLAGADRNGPQYVLRLEENISKGDVEVEENGVRLVFERCLEGDLKGSQIDYIDERFGSGFVIRDQNFRSCGYNCGSCGYR